MDNFIHILPLNSVDKLWKPVENYPIFVDNPTLLGGKLLKNRCKFCRKF
ncbi:hypothetical protein [Raineya sp.]